MPRKVNYSTGYGYDDDDYYNYDDDDYYNYEDDGHDYAEETGEFLST